MKELNKKDIRSFGYKFGYMCGILLVASVVTLVAVLAVAAVIAVLRYIF